MTTPPDQPSHGSPPPQQPGWGPPSSPQGFPAQPPGGQPYPQQPHQQQPYPQPGHPQDPGHPQPGPGYQPMPGYQDQPPQYAQPHPDQARFPGQAAYPGQAAQPGQFGQQPGQPGQFGQPGPFGQPGQPGQFGQPGQPAYPQQFPPPPAKGTSRGAKALVAVVALGIVGIVIAGIIANITGPSGAEAGDCIKVISASVTDADVEKVECSSPEAAFKVAANLDSSADSCPDGDYAEYSDSGGRRSNGFKLCLMLNAAEGDCFKEEGSIVAGKTTKVTCDSSASYKVGKVVRGRADENECESGDTVTVYSQPATTICMTEA
ncbi:LppU/SCO3897 family protein [Saccharothrix luteola]|uniref:LppU/SCO3897 family protein n=1 Tax=Saccharothrix luteola TaxID=2893018 RepID=UPI001E423452|nr:hypothetical protein [Saccharothrix luteola]MCC8247888.1 hypothetical protein [Saccharothrix luteola]